MILGITYNDDASATGFNLIALGNALRRVVRALGMKIRPDLANDGAHIVFRKDHDGVHIRQRRQNLRAFFRRHHWTAFTFQRAHGIIGIYRDNQFAAEFPGGTQVAYMANVQQIETTVRQRDAIAGAAPICHELLKFVARNNFRMK